MWFILYIQSCLILYSLWSLSSLYFVILISSLFFILTAPPLVPVGQLSRFWQDPAEPVPDGVGLGSPKPLTPMTTATTSTTVTVEAGIEYYLPTDARHWIPNGFIKVDLEVDSEELAEDFYGTISAVAEDWADANLGAGVFSQVIMEP